MAPNHQRTNSWLLLVDTGGTFTDCLARDPEGHVHRVKVLSSSALRGSVAALEGPARLRVAWKWADLPAGFFAGFRLRFLDAPDDVHSIHASRGGGTVLELETPLAPTIAAALVAGGALEVLAPEEAPLLAARLVTRTPGNAPLPPLALRLATTRGTNALLERRGARTALFTTAGFADLLEIGTQERPDLFALAIEKPPPLHEAVVEVEERVGSDGAVLAPLRADALGERARDLVGRGVSVAAVALTNSYRNPAHEEEVARLLLAAGFEHVSTSSGLARSIKLLPRAQTAVVDAYLAPVIGDYLAAIRAEVPRGSLRVMTSAGGLAGAERFAAKDSLLSGPAGGVAGAARAGAELGVARVIAFDMGGTSTDVSRHDGDFEYVFEHTVGDARLSSPALAIHTVAAGGGSICTFDGERLRVGPESAGAYPGPACYGAGGPLAITDVNVLLGRIDPERFEFSLDLGQARTRLEEAREALRVATGEIMTPESLLEGFLAIANERMADAIRQVSLRRGYDPSDYVLVAFGGAGAQHACAVAEDLDMKTVVVPRDASLLSAFGLEHAAIERFREEQVLQPLEETEPTLEERLDRLAESALAALAEDDVPERDRVVRRRLVFLRYAGQESTVSIEATASAGDGSLRERFEERYRALNGHTVSGRAIEVESLRVVASTTPRDVDSPGTTPQRVHPPPSGRHRMCIAGAWRDVPLFDRDGLSPGSVLDGPALVREAHTVTVLDESWQAEVHPTGHLVLHRRRRASKRRGRGEKTRAAPVRLELFTNRLRSIAGEMGEMLQRTALSTNVKERRDFSCAVLDRRGELVVNAPHIPVHLGALGLCVRRLREAMELRPGDVVVTNHPAHGGSHLPDVTVVTPVHQGDGELLGYVANRAHHAEIGGSRPGSMPPDARSLAEEGVVIEPLRLIAEGRESWDALAELLRSGPYPSRAVNENLADIRAAVAANHLGAGALRALAAEHGAPAVASFMAALKKRAAQRAREALRRLPSGTHRASEELDDGTPLQVAIDIDGGRATVDFAGTAGVHPGNLNATPAIVQSVVLYVVRLLIDEQLPLNDGLLEAIEVRIPEGILSPAFPADSSRAPAVVGGNVETSQVLVGLLLKALGVAASSQGTMNNVLFGSERFGYYETVCGGAGAGPSFDGASAVHTHMTNTRITDVEVLEHRYPVRVRRFAVRRGSGGAGLHRGGDGVVRELEFTEPVSLSVITQHRRVAPYGLEGGAPGKTGAQRVIRAHGEVLELGSVDGCELRAGDRFVLETPGGGGWGARSRGRSS